MKLLHTADWHIGRTLNGYSLLAEQEQAFQQILQIALDEHVDGIVVAGDLYDRAVPNTDAVTALDHMFRAINIEHQLPIYAISGNHDGAKRLNYGREWLANTGFHLNTLLEEAFTPIETASTQIFLLPFFDPMDARVYYSHQGMSEDQTKAIHTINDAMQLVIADLVKLFDPQKRHLLVTHFAVTASADDELDLTSETTSKVGGLASLPASLFEAFDYVMLGHIHTRLASPMKDKIRYAGSPVKFNVKEANPKFHGKGVEIVDITADHITHTFKPITPHTDLIALKAPWKTLTDPEYYHQQPCNQAWFAITIEDFDRSQHLNVRAELQKIYGTVVELDYADTQAKPIDHPETATPGTLSPDDLVGQFFHAVTGHDLSQPQQRLVDNIFIDLSQEE
ncbi:metallophosphoesterase family protein [Levilactobacillus suantsaii]|uniref:Nuclease SbcCD subunit D n=1 Tax=Levilactobacillus suantsaii TaxID=2292255 RepID=A0A4Q0VK89_9LACO|nr:exonuclease SbcCD subunit D [Levilactobacillus suantsaii]QMU07659.1 exonuclease SbcCD subunit D [Levilactobacillus suantsaii]RXI78640.1 exonuclease SbcCD subunit D [Levilactobacillus suantsaii]